MSSIQSNVESNEKLPGLRGSVDLSEGASILNLWKLRYIFETKEMAILPGSSWAN